MAQTEGCMTRTVQSGLPLNNIPIINLFREFQLWDKWIHSEQRQFASGHREPIRTPLLIWGGMPEDLLTLILQRTILGLDSFSFASSVQTSPQSPDRCRANRTKPDSPDAAIAWAARLSEMG